MLSTGALADDAKPAAPALTKSLPITLSGEDVTALSSYLGGLTYAQAAPIMQFLAAKENEAQAAAAKVASPAPKK